MVEIFNSFIIATHQILNVMLSCLVTIYGFGITFRTVFYLINGL